MGYVSQRSRGYENGFVDSFLNHLKSYRFSYFNSIFSVTLSKNSPETEYIEGYEKGFEHGKIAREEFIIYSGKTPISYSDFSWLNSEREKQKLLDYFNTTPDYNEFSLNKLKEKYEYFVNLITDNRIYRVLKDSNEFFYQTKNLFGYNSSTILLERLEANRQAKAFNKISKEASSDEFLNISNEICSLIEKELKTTIDALNQYNSITNSIDSKAILTNASEFVMANQTIIQQIIVNNWKIPLTKIPGQYAETFNRVIKWFDNFKKSEYELALLILQNIQYISDYDIDQLLEKMCGELKSIFGEDFSKVCFFGLGNSGGDSGNQFLYTLKQNLHLKSINFPKDYRHLHPSINCIVFVDDMIGSGNQAIQFYKESLKEIKEEMYYYSLIGFEGGIKNLKMNTRFKDVFTTKIYTESQRAFSPESEIFYSSEIRKQIEIMAKSYGALLYPKGTLGYDDSQALVVFSHNTPNNTLPIIWASEKNEKTIGVPWNPIWERKKYTTKS